MAPEYGATCGFFPIDQETLNYLAFTGRDPGRVKLVEAYAKAQGMWRDASTPDPVFTDARARSRRRVEPSLAGPKRPQDRVALSADEGEFREGAARAARYPKAAKAPVRVEKGDYSLRHGDVVIAAITSCTNTSNPAVLIAAGLLAKKARRARPQAQALGQDLAGAGLAGRHRLPR
jgi:aconitate hydratase